MVSRRNIRIKVMQLLYSIETTSGNPPEKNNPLNLLRKQFERSQQLLVYLLDFIVRVARYSETDARQRASKNLVTNDDLNVNTKIAGNEQLKKILENKSYKEAVSKIPAVTDEEEWVRKIYLSLVDTVQYKQYIAEKERQKNSEVEILKFILLELMLLNDDYVSFSEENFINFDDDAALMLQLLNSYLQKPGSFSLTEDISNDKWMYAKELFETVIEKKEYLLGIVKPKLNNWDADRIAVIDMILLWMGVAELLYFETIPPKVTINEYIDIAKEYSTQQSGQFINGILDSIHKDFLAENKIQKKEFRKI
ncbi:MAG: transcription antitermination factor NusB [Chitinophagaceae bacterium]|nr:transcription antitermination factor NusB [Chitinophagaceae bacterium]